MIKDLLNIILNYSDIYKYSKNEIICYCGTCKKLFNINNLIETIVYTNKKKGVIMNKEWLCYECSK